MSDRELIAQLTDALDEITDMSNFRFVARLNHVYQLGCNCLCCAADRAVEAGRERLRIEDNTKDDTKPAESARCTACETRLVDGQCPICPPVESAKCGEVVMHLIAGASWFPCALEKGHDEKEGHRAAGNCFAHGVYLGKPGAVPECPQWPTCITELLKQQREGSRSGVESAGEPTPKLYPAAPDGSAHPLEECEHGHPHYTCVACKSVPGDARAWWEANKKEYSHHPAHWYFKRIPEALDAFARSRTVSLEAQLAERNAMYEGMLERADERNGKLVEALTRYGQHAENCAEKLPSKEPRPKCTCGFTDVKEGTC